MSFFQKYILKANNIEPDQEQHSVASYLVPNCLPLSYTIAVRYKYGNMLVEYQANIVLRARRN